MGSDMTANKIPQSTLPPNGTGRRHKRSGGRLSLRGLLLAILLCTALAGCANASAQLPPPTADTAAETPRDSAEAAVGDADDIPPLAAADAQATAPHGAQDIPAQSVPSESTGLTLRVVDAAGRPIQGARLTGNAYTVEQMWAAFAVGNGIDGEVLNFGPSGADGIIHWPDPFAEGTFVLTLQTDGSGPVRNYQVEYRGSPQEITLLYDALPEWPASGALIRFTDLQGNPVQGVSLLDGASPGDAGSPAGTIGTSDAEGYLYWQTPHDGLLCAVNRSGTAAPGYAFQDAGKVWREITLIWRIGETGAAPVDAFITLHITDADGIPFVLAFSSTDRMDSYSDRNGNLYFWPGEVDSASDEYTLLLHAQYDSATRTLPFTLPKVAPATITVVWQGVPPATQAPQQTDGMRILVVDSAGAPVEGLYLTGAPYTKEAKAVAQASGVQLEEEVFLLGPSDSEGLVRWQGPPLSGTYELYGYIDDMANPVLYEIPYSGDRPEDITITWER